MILNIYNLILIGENKMNQNNIPVNNAEEKTGGDGFGL
jgi:hypothetical protein